MLINLKKILWSLPGFFLFIYFLYGSVTDLFGGETTMRVVNSIVGSSFVLGFFTALLFFGIFNHKKNSQNS